MPTLKPRSVSQATPNQRAILDEKLQEAKRIINHYTRVYTSFGARRGARVKIFDCSWNDRVVSEMEAIGFTKLLQANGCMSFILYVD